MKRRVLIAMVGLWSGTACVVPNNTSSSSGDGGSKSVASSSASSGSGGGTSTASASSSSASSSAESSSASGPCIPKTCLTLAVELAGGVPDGGTVPDACGLLSDGCGNFIDCMGCVSPFNSCGGIAPKPNTSWSGPGVNGIPNLCGGGCTILDDDQTSVLGCIFSAERAVDCSGPTNASGSSNPPPGLKGCHTSPGQILPTQIETYWCCTLK